MRGSSPARARWSEAPNKCLRPGKWPGPSGEVTRRREPGAVFSPGRASQHAYCQHPLDHQKSKSVPEKHALVGRFFTTSATWETPLTTGCCC